MSAGSRNRIVRIDDASWHQLERVVNHRNANRDATPWTMSDFVRKACWEKVAKMARSRGRKLTAADDLVDLAVVAQTLKPEENLFTTIEDGGAIA